MLQEFAMNVYDTWSRYLGPKLVESAADNRWKMLAPDDGGVDRVLETLARMFPSHQGEQRALWNLLITHKYWLGHLLRAHDLTFVSGGRWHESLMFEGHCNFNSTTVEKVAMSKSGRANARVSTQLGGRAEAKVVDSFNNGATTT